MKGISFAGEVKSGETFRYQFGDNLYFLLLPNDHGWQMAIGPQDFKQGVDYIYPVNTPYRFNYLQSLDGSYEDPAFPDDREFAFLLDQNDHKIAETALHKVLWPKTDAEQEKNLTLIANLQTGAGTLHILDGKAVRNAGDKDDKRMIVQWLKFRVDLSVPLVKGQRCQE